MRQFIQWSVNRPALANILMVALLLMGGYFALNTKREVLPEFSLDRVQVSVVYKGASAEEIEESVCVKIEEKIAGIEGIDRITSKAVEGKGIVIAELHDDADAGKALDDIKNAVDQIDTFPKDTETPIVVELTQKKPVIKVSVYGNVSERLLTSTADRVRDDLMTIPGISQVELVGDREYELLIEVSENTLRKYGLTLSQVADLVRSNSLDLPGGVLESRSGRILLRTKGQLYTAPEFEEMVILARTDGTAVKLGELARITETFEDVDVQPRMNGKRAIAVSVSKTSEEDALEIAAQVKKYVAHMNNTLPPDVRLAFWSDDSIPIKSRLELLAKNGLQGLLLVFVILSLFLRLRLAFWVVLGIPISVVGSFVYLGLTDFTLNMLTMFSFIVVLGVVVDDAIVIGENVYTKLTEGQGSIEAAVNGASELAYPVINSVATTMVAFAPMFFVAGAMGKLMKVFPVAIIVVLVVSLFEAFMILPAHLAHMRRDEDMSKRYSPFAVIERIRRRFDAGLQDFIDRRFVPAMEFVMRQRYAFSALLIACFMITVGLIATGRLPFVVFPKMDSDTLTVTLTFPEGTSFDTTLKTVEHLEASARKLDKEYPRADGRSVIRNVFSIAGEEIYGDEKGSHIAEMVVELLPSEERGIPSFDMAGAWRELTGEIPEAVAVTFSSELHGAATPGGIPIEIRLMGDDIDQLRGAAAMLKDHLSTFAGVEDIQDSYRPAKKEFRLSLKPGARQLGVTLADLAQQVRASFWGEEALKIQRGRKEVTVRVRYPEYGKAEPGDLEQMKIRTSKKKELPFGQVARVSNYQGAASVDRIHRKRAITVTADVDEEEANAQQIVGALESNFFDKLREAYPGVSILVEGQRKSTAESMGSLKTGFVVAVIIIYILLVNQFRTYTQPLVIMVAIPFSIIGVVAGHFLFGLALTLLSMFGVLALAGIVVNDSLLLVHSANTELEKGAPLDEALVIAGRGRFRQIILTSLSTMGGLTPILMETSFQAQFLKPMTVSVVFGLLFSTILILLFVPSLLVIRRDIIALGSSLK
ncbi:efflux RND transporter permease subunit [Thermodesulfobacteriota bacterium]